MSRIGKLPIKIPKDVDISYNIESNFYEIIVKGKFGTLQTSIPKIIKIKQEETVSVNVDGRNKILSSSLLKIKTNVKHEENSSDNMEDMNVSNNDKEIIFQQLEEDINDNESSIIKQHMHQVSPSVNANDFDSINNNASSINKPPSVINGINMI